MTTYLPEGMRLHTMENQTALQSVAALQAAMHRKQILEARAIVCDAAHNLIVELPHMRGIIPREEGAIGIAEGTTREIALIAKAGKPVCFQVQKLTTDADGVPLAILSRRQAQLQCWQEFLSHCTPGDVLPARVTHMEKFGCFVDIGCGIPSMIPIDYISVLESRTRLTALPWGRRFRQLSLAFLIFGLAYRTKNCSEHGWKTLQSLRWEKLFPVSSVLWNRMVFSWN